MLIELTWPARVHSHGSLGLVVRAAASDAHCPPVKACPASDSAAMFTRSARARATAKLARQRVPDLVATLAPEERLAVLQLLAARTSSPIAGDVRAHSAAALCEAVEGATQKQALDVVDWYTRVGPAAAHRLVRSLGEQARTSTGTSDGAGTGDGSRRGDGAPAGGYQARVALSMRTAGIVSRIESRAATSKPAAPAAPSLTYKLTLTPLPAPGAAVPAFTRVGVAEVSDGSVYVLTRELNKTLTGRICHASLMALTQDGARTAAPGQPEAAFKLFDIVRPPPPYPLPAPATWLALSHGMCAPLARQLTRLRGCRFQEAARQVQRRAQAASTPGTRPIVSEDPLREAQILQHLVQRKGKPGSQYVAHLQAILHPLPPAAGAAAPPAALVLDYAGGGELLDYHCSRSSTSNQRYLPSGEVLRVMLELLSGACAARCARRAAHLRLTRPPPQRCGTGVAFLHRNRIAHYDLSPENVLLDSDGHVKIIDFGGAGTIPVNGYDVVASRRPGKPGYRPPEVGPRGQWSFRRSWWIMLACLCASGD